MSRNNVFRTPKLFLYFIPLALYVTMTYAAVSAFADNGSSFMPRVPVPLIADPTVSFYRLVPPKSLGPLLLVQNSTINVNFLPNGSKNSFYDSCITWPAGAQAAFLYAASLWESYLYSPVPIVIEACWTSLSPGVLAHGGSIDFEYDFAGAPELNTLYNVALANALHGSDLEPASDDISVAFNNSFSPTLSWYFGTDGNPPVNSYDLVSVALHEITHGLGFTGTMRGNSPVAGQAQWGLGLGMPAAYDWFAVNDLSQGLIDTGVFANPSAELYDQLTGGNVYFDGPNARAANGNNNAKLYAPAAWSSGSSYSHLDEVFNETPDTLMTYSLKNREVVHVPGPVTLNILRDIGWTITGACYYYSLDSTGGSFDLNGGAGFVTVTAGAGCGWTAVSNDSWIHVTSGSPGNGSGTTGYSVDSYTGTGSRTGTITIVGQTFTVTQTGCSYTLTPDKKTFTYLGGSGSFSVTTQSICPRSATESLDWVTIDSAGGTGAGTVDYTVALYPGIPSRTGNINVGDKTLIITQTGILPVADFSAAPTIGTAPFQVAFTDSSSNATSWLWDFGDGQTSTLQYPVHTYKTTAGGHFTVSLTATNANGSNMMTQTGYITVNTCGNPPVRVSGVLDGTITTIQDAYGSVAAGGTNPTPIDIQAIDFPGPLTFNEDKIVTLIGGYTCDYLSRIPEALVIGSITIGKGKVIFDRISIR